MRFSAIPTALVLALLAAPSVFAGPLEYGLCQTQCNADAVACYTSAGATFGTITAEDASPTIVKCNNALSTCSAACAVVTLRTASVD